eukprot:CAMPEP_0185558602 /NCGR_PEP_ID=MMETSP1381-20130426/52630_1 /TAXON_ID=298111 /ORGANISM="Pavlova sp., Strain CCMP459" /LENGTH=62 /DNA_ID=CAMNT_0028172161 /DNA_START=183 /DNA_END=367 /DNA_ORIENTATION=-
MVLPRFAKRMPQHMPKGGVCALFPPLVVAVSPCGREVGVERCCILLVELKAQCDEEVDQLCA